jgi:uncharacterized protein YndB with AHSA1/START domain
MTASNARLSAAVDTSDRELIFTRVFDAPRELVFEAWTQPEHVAQWWGPQGFSTTISEMDVRPGGVWRLVMRGPDGTDYKNRLVFLEVDKPRRLVYKHDPEPGSEPSSHQVTVTFAEDGTGAKTRLTMQMVFASAAAREYIVKKYKAVEGANQTLGRLAEHLPKMIPQELVITRVFDAPREVVFEAWIDPARLRQWWGPKGFTNPVCEIDPRPGGAIYIVMQAPDGGTHPMSGVFEEIVAPERIVFTSGALDVNGQSMFDILNTITFSERGGQTELALRAKVTRATAEAPQYLKGMNQGWSQSLDRLNAFVKLEG